MDDLLTNLEQLGNSLNKKWDTFKNWNYSYIKAVEESAKDTVDNMPVDCNYKKQVP